MFLKENGHYRATASLDIDNNKIENLPEPREDSDAATKKYVDDVAKTLTLDEALVKENGGYNIIDNAYINMNFGNIRNIGEPSLISDAATKGYVDESITKEIKKGIEKETHHLIAAHASYHGDLIKDDYQFTFGGSSVESYKRHNKYNGFVMPHSGYIKRFVVKSIGFKMPSENIDNEVLLEIFKLCRDNNYNDIRIITKSNIIPLFSLNIIKNDGEVVQLGVLNMQITVEKCEDYYARPIANMLYFFTSPLPEGLEKYHLSPKDVLNIQTEFNTEKLNNLYLIVDNKPIEADYDDSINIHVSPLTNYKDPYLNPETEFFTYLATILIELDPL